MLGRVLSLRHLELGELFAMKVMKPEAFANGEAVERFQREARAATKLASEHAVTTSVGWMTALRTR
jgi:serine/threonine-protein kinase